MSKYAVRGAIREVKNYTKGYTDLQAKVRQATSNDPWGSSGTLMSEIADATYNKHAFIEIMEMIDKRLNDSGKNWRHVFKALTLLDYCLHSGSDNVVAYARENLYIVKTLREFQYVDEEGRDQGANVRQKAKDITSLLSDTERLRRERSTRNAMRDRMAGATPDRLFSEEDSDLQRAIEESKRTAQEEQERKMMRANGGGLRTAGEVSEAKDWTQGQKDTAAVVGGSARPDTFDPFESFHGSEVTQQQSNSAAGNLMEFAFGCDMSQGGFDPYQQQQTALQQAFGAGGANGFGTTPTAFPPTNQATNPFGSAFGGVPFQNTVSTSGFETSASYGAASHFAGDANVSGAVGDVNFSGPNLVRGNAQIDPFASVGGGRSAAVGGGSNPALATSSFRSADFSGPGATASTEQSQAFSTRLLGGNANSGLVNLDSLKANTSLVHHTSNGNRNPFSQSSTKAGSGAQYDWTASPGGGAAGTSRPAQPRTLAELAVGGGSASSSRLAGPMATGWGAATHPPLGTQFRVGQPAPVFGHSGPQQQQQQLLPFASGPFQQHPAAAGHSPFGSQTSLPFGALGGPQPATGSNLLF